MVYQTNIEYFRLITLLIDKLIYLFIIHIRENKNSFINYQYL